MSFIDVKYIQLVSSRLVLFSRKKADLYNFRCPYCGDSQKRRNKARGYLFKVKNDFVFKCHNCGMGRTLANFLKDQDTFLHDQYVMEKFKDGKTGKGTTVPNPKFNFQEPKFFSKREKSVDLEKISDLNISHPAREYLEQRGIKDLDYFYYCPKFKAWTNEQKKMFDNLKQDSPRIIIPFRDKEGNLFGYQGRSLAPKAKLRYITIMLDEEQPKIFGLDRVKEDKPYTIVHVSTELHRQIHVCQCKCDEYTIPRWAAIRVDRERHIYDTASHRASFQKRNLQNAHKQCIKHKRKHNTSHINEPLDVFVQYGSTQQEESY